MSHLSRIIAEEIRSKGPISMARFMELALYCPDYGYYERDADNIGALGDFQTSVSVGPVFGELLAAQFSIWLEEIPRPLGGVMLLVEAGAHNGQLAWDILNWLVSKQAELVGLFRYAIVEPSSKRRGWQRQKLARFAEQICWYSDFDELQQQTRGLHGIIFSNEVLDAFPVHRLVWNRNVRGWTEVLVDHQCDKFVWVNGENPPCDIQRTMDEMVPEPLRAVLPDGFVMEYGNDGLCWWKQAADSLKCGRLLTIDYGMDQEGMVSPDKLGGTLRSYQHHQVGSEVLSNPGELDITAHVRFDLVRQAGERCGLQTDYFGDQSQFLVEILRQTREKHLDADQWSSRQLRQFKTLIHPDHFGRTFKVLVQSRR